jgi:DNA-directed RNA polymerase specialized sigma24 family protein
VSAAEDQATVDKVLAGDISAFEEIVRRWQSPLVNLAYRFCHDRGRAEDMAQEAFLRAYRSLDRWRREAAFSTWLLALATNLYCSDHGRQLDRDGAMPEPGFRKAFHALRPESLTWAFFTGLQVLLRSKIELTLASGAAKIVRLSLMTGMRNAAIRCNIHATHWIFH